MAVKETYKETSARPEMDRSHFTDWMNDEQFEFIAHHSEWTYIMTLIQSKKHSHDLINVMSGIDVLNIIHSLPTKTSIYFSDFVNSLSHIAELKDVFSALHHRRVAGTVMYGPELQQTLIGFVPYGTSYRQTPIETAIERSKYILDLDDNWDEEGAQGIPVKTYETAITFLHQYSQFLSEILGVAIAAPEINPVKNGSIDLEWHTEKARMLINIKLQDQDYHAFYYGDLYKGKSPFKGSVQVDEFSEFLAYWMKQLV